MGIVFLSDESRHDLGVIGRPPIFLLSFEHRTELAAAAEKAEWAPVAARRANNAADRFAASGAQLAVVDARGAFVEALAAIGALGEVARMNGAALLVLLARDNMASLGAILDAGATHYLAAPFDDAEFAQALAFAARHAERIADASGYPPRRGVAEWRWRPGDREVSVNMVLARRLGLSAPGPTPIRPLLRRLRATGLSAMRSAVARLIEGAGTAAFAHDSRRNGNGGRIAHHLHRDSEDGAVVGRVEPTIPEDRSGGASRDPLTGLEDAHGAQRWLAKRLAKSAKPRGCTLILLSMTRFDAINAAFGHALGDALLAGIGQRIERYMDEGGWRGRLVARIAPDEFVIGLPATIAPEAAWDVASGLAALLVKPFEVGGHVISLSTRIGVASSAGGGDSAATLLHRAASALAEARASEASPIRLFDAEVEQRAAQRQQLEIDLRLALDRDQIDVLFQPQFDVASGAIVGVEALARWPHPELGELGATTLFAAASRSDYLTQLSEHVQRKALARIAEWPEALDHLRVAINVTAADIARPGFVERFFAMLDMSGVARERITVEITETGLVADLDAAATMLARLRDGGLKVAIDDFGTGYSSLAYLNALPLDYLKIDHQLARDILDEGRGRVVVESVIGMARLLQLEVIAEGVETQAQLDLLAAAGCDIYQGFLSAPPLDDTALIAMVGHARA